MKKTLTLVGLGACAVLAFSSCKSTKGDGYEEALPMSFVADDESAPWESEIPDWLTQDSSNAPQRDAGATTILPAPEEPVADSSGKKVSTSQNRPKVTPVENDVVIAEAPAPADTTLQPVETPVVSAPVSKPSTTKSGAGKIAATKKKPAKKISQPTLVVYKVRKGDNLTLIAKRSNTTVAQIRRDSGITGDTIYPGQTIKVRYTPAGYKPTASKGKNDKGKKGTTKPNTKGGKTYTVRSGDTASAIAKRNGISTAALLKANGMTGADAAKMRPGKKLVIPKN